MKEEKNKERDRRPFITLKANFHSNPKGRQINTAKAEINIIRKYIFDLIISKLKF